MKYLKLFESFSEEDIHATCKKYKITNYIINNGVVDVDGDVILSGNRLVKIPLKFNNISGSFNCSNNFLTSLEGCPKYVGGAFICSTNKLTTLEGCPTEVESFYCFNNQLISLEGCPKEVIDDFDCANNRLTSLIGCPTEIGGYFDCNFNGLTSLEGCPMEVGSDFHCYQNPVEEVYDLFPNHKSFIDSLDYNYFRGDNKINKIRLTQALAEFGLECPENINGYVWE